MKKALAVLVFCAFSASSQVDPKKLIKFGWDTPNSRWLERNTRTVEQLPFDGVVFSAYWENEDGSLTLFGDRAWGDETITWDQLSKSADEVKRTTFIWFTDNFLLYRVRPGNVDWFDDFTAILNNARLAAWYRRETKIKGIFFDLESMEFHPFSFEKRKYQYLNEEQYRAQVRERGRQLGEALYQVDPEMVLFLTFSYEMAELASPKEHYALLPAFLDGLYSAMGEGTKIVNGFESAYPYSEPAQFERAYTRMQQDNRNLSAVPESYTARHSAAFAIWHDLYWYREGWKANPWDNVRTPAQFGSSVGDALRRSDNYVWIYSQWVKWLQRQNLQWEYIDALWQVRRSLGMN